MAERAKIAIIGAGFGGLWAARELAAHDVDVTLIDRHNYHAFLPLLYQVAAAELGASQIAHPIRQILHSHPNVRFLLADAHSADLNNQRIVTSAGDVEYDHLILALGSKHHFFGVPGAETHAFPLKTIDHAVNLRHHILRTFERASAETDPHKRQALLTFTIVGGGPTGVEYAGALSELVNRPLRKDFPELNVDNVRIVLIEGSDRLVGMLSAESSAYTRKRLEKMGVEVQVGRLVSEVAAERITYRNDDTLDTRTVVWTAGVQGETLSFDRALASAGARQVAVEPTLHVRGFDNVYAIGDMAFLEENDKPLPMLAPVATQQGTHAARNIARTLRDEAPLPFRYRDRGTMATIGRNSAVAQIGNATFTGFIAWVMWLVIHLLNLIGFHNRVVVLINWAWDYLFFERVSRLILTRNAERERVR